MTVSIYLIIYSLQLATLGLLIFDLFIPDLLIILLGIFILPLTSIMECFTSNQLRSPNLRNQESAEILFVEPFFT